jgi:SSS family transporter
LNALDYTIVTLYFSAMIWLGMRFKRNAAGTDYFLGSRALGWFPLGMSTMATQLSAVSFVSAPAFVGLRNGGGMQWLTYEFGVPLAMIPLMAVLGPMLRRSGVVSVYSFLEGRFGRGSRLLLSALFVFSRAFGTGVQIYVIALVLASILVVPFWQTMIALGSVTIVYSLKGGLKAIVYSEVAQMIIKVLGIFTIMFTALHYLGGWSSFLEHLDHRRLQVIDVHNFGFDGREYGFWPMLLGGLFLYTAYYGTDQTQAQRILAARDERTVKNLLLFNGLLRFPITLAYCSGGLILGAFALATPQFRAAIPADKPDLMIPVFISNYLPHGVVGIIVVALIAAWMSAYSSTLNSLTAVTMEDFVSPRVAIPQERYVGVSKYVLLAWGAATMILGFFAGRLAATAIEAINKIGSVSYGPILGIFLLTTLPRVTPLAANIAVATGVCINIILWLFFPNVFWFWWNAIGAVVTVGVGVVLGLIFGRPRRSAETLSSAETPSVPALRAFPLRESAVMLLVFLFILVVCLLLPRVAHAEDTNSFRMTATSDDFKLYFPTYLANGHFSAASSPRGSDPTLAYVAGLMDYTPDDVSRPAAIPSWTEIDYSDGHSWLNRSPLTPEALRQYQQTLDMQLGTLTTRYTWVGDSRSSRIAITTFVSERAAHEGATNMEVVPEFDGEVRLRFTLRPWPKFPHRLPMAKLTLPEIKRAIANTYHLGTPDGKSLLSQMLKPSTTTSANRETVWYPGEVEIQQSGASDSDRTLWVRGRALNGASFAEAAAIALPGNLENPHVTVESSRELVVLDVSGTVRKGRSYSFTKFVAVSREKWGGTAEQDVALVRQARDQGWATRLAAHQATWHELWQADILVDDRDLQRAVHSDLFYLLQNSTDDGASPMTACGFSANYFHHVFWDNDSWDFPVLLLLHPERAKSQVAFRYLTLHAAAERAAKNGYKGSMYPWESDPFSGTDQTPYFAHENAEREIHLNGDIAIAQWQYYLATGDVSWLRQFGYPVIRATAAFWVSRVVYQRPSDRYEILHVTSPDEAYNDVNNDSFTNAVAQRNLQIATAAAKVVGASPDPAWEQIASKIYIPFSAQEQRHLDFDLSVPHDKQTWMGSSLAFLAYPPLDLAMAPAIRRNDFSFALRSLRELSPDTNAMLLAMISVEAAELGDQDAADKWLQRQQAGFLKPPFNVRSETAKNNTTYILATSAGFLQNFLYGFSGLRITEAGLTPQYRPVMPRGWKSLVLRNVAFRGKRFDYVLQRDERGEVRLGSR